MENFLYTLAVAAITGLTFIAYKHPTAYGKMFNLLMTINFFAFSMAFTWNLAALQLWVNIQPLLMEKSFSLEPFRAAFNSMQIPNVPLLIGFFIVIIYLTFLSSLPRILDSRKS